MRAGPGELYRRWWFWSLVALVVGLMGLLTQSSVLALAALAPGWVGLALAVSAVINGDRERIEN